MSQTDYLEQPAAYAGMLYDLSDGGLVDTYLQGEASAQIQFGAMVQRTAAPSAGTPGLAKALAAGGDVLAGVVVHSHAYDKRLELGTTGILPKNLMGVMTRGRVWVNAEVAVTADTDDVFARYTANGGMVVGNFRNDADTSKATQIEGARFIMSTTAADVVPIEIDMQVHQAMAT